MADRLASTSYTYDSGKKAFSEIRLMKWSSAEIRLVSLIFARTS